MPAFSPTGGLVAASQGLTLPRGVRLSCARGGASSAAASASSMSSSHTNLSCLRAGSGISSRSFLFRCGSSTVLMPARSAASVFSFTPPIGSTSPRRLISPVIAISLRTVRPDNSDATARNIATPALGPSFGMAPAGKWMCRSFVSSTERSDAELVEPHLRETHGGLRALLHHVAELAREDQLALARHQRGFDEQDVAADGRPSESCRDARHARAELHLVLEVPRARGSRARRPRRSSRSAAVPSAIFIAACRSSAPISRSRLRTPASRV